MARVKNGGGGSGEREKGEGRNRLLKEPSFFFFALHPQIFWLSDYISCQFTVNPFINWSEHSVHLVPLDYTGFFVCQREYLSSRQKGFCSQSEFCGSRRPQK